MRKCYLLVALALIMVFSLCSFGQFVEDWESGDLGMWTTYQTGTGSVNFTINSTYKHAGSYGIGHNFSSSGNHYSWLVTPLLTLSGDLSISFWDYNRFTSDFVGHALYVSNGSPDPSDGDYELITNLTVGSSTWRNLSYSYPSYGAGDEVYVAFYYQGNNADSWYLDDIVINGTPPMTYDITGTTNLSDTPGLDGGVTIIIPELGIYTTSDAFGDFEFEGISEGTYTFVASYPEYLFDRRVDVVVSAVAAPSVDFVLYPAFPLLTENFEADNGGFVTDDATVWQWGAPTSGPMGAFEGENCWATVLDGDYANYDLAFLTVPIPETYEPVEGIGWMQWFDSETSPDGMTMVYSSNNGVDWYLLPNPLPYYNNTGVSALGGLPAWTGHNGDEWTEMWADFSLITEEVTDIGFVFGSDISLTYDGFYIDNVVFYGEEPDPTTFEITTDLLDTPEFGDGEIEFLVVETGTMHTTDEDGFITLGLVAGTYTFQALLPGYAPVDVTVSGEPSTTVPVLLELQPDNSGWITGVAELSDLGPVEDIRIFVYDTEAETMTEADGSFIFTNIPSGNLIVFAEYEGYYIASSEEFALLPGDIYDAGVIELFPLFFEGVSCNDMEDLSDPMMDYFSVTGTLWEVGVPTSGPSDAHSGNNCWGTNIDGNYTTDALSELVYDLSSFDAFSGVTYWQSINSENGFDGGQIHAQDGDGNWHLMTPDVPYHDDAISSLNDFISGEPAYTGRHLDWEKVTVDMRGIDNPQKIKFLFASDGSVSYPGWYVDDICLFVSNPDRPTTDVTGYVYDDETFEPIPGAMVEILGHVVYADEAGYFEIPGLDVGVHDYVASNNGYFPTIDNVALTQYASVALYIPLTPVEFSPAIDMPATVEVAFDKDDEEVLLTFCNTTDETIEWNFRYSPESASIARAYEAKGEGSGFTDGSDSDNPDPDFVYDPNGLTSYGKEFKTVTETPAGLRRTADLGDVIATYDVDVDLIAWGLGIQGSAANNIWVGDIDGLSAGGIHQFRFPSMDATGRFIDPYADLTASWTADMTWDGDYVWVVAVGGDNNIHAFDPVTTEYVTMIEDPNGIWNNESQRGLAYNGMEDIFYIAGWNSDKLWTIKGLSWDNPGEIIYEHTLVGVSGLGFSYCTGTVWAGINDEPDRLVEMDPITGETITDYELPHDYYISGVEVNGNGEVLYIDQENSQLIVLDVAATCTFTDGLRVRPVRGSLEPGECITLTVEYDAYSLEPGVYPYDGTLFINGFEAKDVPFNVHVIPSADYGWNFITVPVDAEPNEPWAQLHDDITPFSVSTSASQLYSWDPIRGMWTIPDEFERGRGYILWAWFDNTKFDVYGANYTEDIEVELIYDPDATHAGRNLIGNPFNFGINWDEVVNDPQFENISRTVIFYDPLRREYSSYTPGVLVGGASSIIDPWQGFIINTNHEGGLVPFKSEYTEGAAKIAPVKKSKDALEDFALRISAQAVSEDNEYFDTWNYLATRADAADGSDIYDVAEIDLEIPGASAYELKASFVQGAQFFMNDFKSTLNENEEKTWTMRVSGLELGAEVTLSWPGSQPDSDHDGSNGVLTISDVYTLQAVHPVTGEVIDMREDTAISFTYDGPTEVSFRVASYTLSDNDTPVVPNTYSVTNSPNPFNASTSIIVELPADDHVTVEVYDISGNRINVLASEDMTAGRTNILWNGTDLDGNVVPSGVYLYKVHSSNGVDTNRMILLK